MLAIPWYLTNISGEYSFYGILYGLITGVSIFWMLFSGTLIDRYDRKNIFLGINAVGAIIFLGLAGYGFFIGEISIYLASTGFAATFFIFNIHFPNLYAFAQEITDKKDYGRIISYLEIQHQLTSATSGAIGAMLLAGVDINYFNLGFIGTFEFPVHIFPWELKQVLFLDGLTYIAAFLLIANIRYIPVVIKSIDHGNIISRLKTGITYLKSHPMLFLFGSVSYSLFICVLVASFFLLPKYTSSHLGSDVDVYSIFEIFYAMGSVIAGIFVSYLFRHTKPTKAIIIMGFLGSAFYFVGVFNHWLWLLFLLSLIMGLTNAGTRIMRATYIFNHVPNQIIGRVSSIFNLYHIIFRLLFIFLFSMAFFSRGNNVIYAFLALGIFITFSMIILMVNYRKIINA